ncbi:MAG: hypothetical protein IPI28_18995 [Candidatus Omnitrophica bacterium]|nr:hypothetical protein [Candidatus Omnitrophota bacterium]
MKAFERWSFMFVPLLTMGAFVRLLLTGGWAEALVVSVGMGSIAFDAYRADKRATEAKDKADAEELKAHKGITELVELRERVMKLELVLNLKPLQQRKVA